MIRSAKQSDLEQIVEIYNQAVAVKFQTADTELFSAEKKQQWFDEHDEHTYPLFVHEENGMVTGWVSISPYRPRFALRFCVEISYYIHSGHRKKGIASQLVEHALDAAGKLGFKNVIAIILDRNIPSVRLMEKFGFHQWALLPNIADFDGEECSHVYYGKRIRD